MQDYLYSIVALAAMVIHLIINPNQFSRRVEIAARGAREYRGFLMGIFAYYVVDAGWGILAGLGWTRALYVDTMVYYIAIAASVLTWCRFVAAYLDFSRWAARALSWFGYALLALYVVLLAANVFNGCLFRFDGQGAYSAGCLRLLIFYPLVALNVLMSICMFVKVLCSRDHARRRAMVAFLFSLTMTVAIILQIGWPLWPYYALGCLIGSCFFHIYVVENERNELRKAVFMREQAEKHMAELENALERAHAAEKARSMFFSIVSHDIRTPLNAILGYSELLQNGVTSQAEIDEALKSIQASGTMLLQLVNDVLDLAKIDSGKLILHPVPVKPAMLTDEVFSSFRLAASSKGLELVNRAADVPTVMLDEHRLRQILFNLVGNAVKFTSKGSVTVAASYSGSNLEMSVSDTGCGIEASKLEHILDPFVQIDDASHSADRAIGTGLGLSICRSLVEAMGGELVVESEFGKWSKFTVRIPGVEQAGGNAKHAAAPRHAAALKDPPKRVLVVDDSPVNRSVLTAFLKRAGVAVVEQASDGEEALAELHSAIRNGSPHDFVFSDFWMPNMNGLELIEKLREDPRLGRLPVFAVTADTEMRTDPRTRLFTGILLKPITYDKLAEALATRG